MLGTIHLLRRRRVTLGQIGAALVILGAIAIASTYVISVFEILGSGDEFDREQVVKLLDDAEESGEAAPIFAMFVFGLLLGPLLLAVGLWRQRAVPVWVPILLVLGSLVNFAGEDQVVAVISGAVIGAALVGLGLKILSVSDDDWERWEVLPDPKAQAAPAAGPPPERPEPA